MGRSVSQPVPSPFPTDPGKMPSVITTELELKYLAAARTASDTATFFGTLEDHGAWVDNAVVDTWYDVCDITGGGYLCNVFSPFVNNSTVDIEITADGSTSTFSFTSASNAFQVCVGAFAIREPIGTANSYSSEHFMKGSPQADGYQWEEFVDIISPIRSINELNGWIRFDDSLLIRTRCDVLATSTEKRRSGATYLLDKGVV